MINDADDFGGCGCCCIILLLPFIIWFWFSNFMPEPIQLTLVEPYTESVWEFSHALKTEDEVCIAKIYEDNHRVGRVLFGTTKSLKSDNPRCYLRLSDSKQRVFVDENSIDYVWKVLEDSIYIYNEELEESSFFKKIRMDSGMKFLRNELAEYNETNSLR